MRLKVYSATTVAEAMARVRAELGPDALILATRKTTAGVEVTAATEPAPPPPLPVQDPSRLAAFRFHGVPAELQAQLQSDRLDAAVTKAIGFGALRTAPGDPPMLLVGPPGAGKTLTAARLATRLVLAGITPMVITTDGKRAGAIEQLAAFTKLLGVNLIVASHPLALSRALARREAKAPVLIDTAGSDPFDSTEAQEIVAFAATASACMTLVLPAGLDPAEAGDLGRAYARHGATALVASRLDLSPRLGGILAAATAGNLTLTEAGIGPGVADGLIPLTPAYLSERLMQTRSAGA